MSKNFLFYSNFCDHSKRFIDKINKTELMNQINLCCVDDENLNIPDFITSVPTLYLVQERNVLTDDQLFQWAELQQSGQQPHHQPMAQQMMQQMSSPQNSSPPQQNNYQQNSEPQAQEFTSTNRMPPQTNSEGNQVLSNVDITGDNNISAYLGGEIGSGFSDQYSFISDADSNTAMVHSFSYLDDSGGPNMPSHNTSNGMGNNQALSSKNRNDIKNDKSAKLDKAFEEMMASRNAELAGTVTNMRR